MSPRYGVTSVTSSGPWILPSDGSMPMGAYQPPLSLCWRSAGFLAGLAFGSCLLVALLPFSITSLTPTLPSLPCLRKTTIDLSGPRLQVTSEAMAFRRGSLLLLDFRRPSAHVAKKVSWTYLILAILLLQVVRPWVVAWPSTPCAGAAALALLIPSSTGTSSALTTVALQLMPCHGSIALLGSLLRVGPVILPPIACGAEACYHGACQVLWCLHQCLSNLVF